VSVHIEGVPSTITHTHTQHLPSIGEVNGRSSDQMERKHYFVFITFPALDRSVNI
jgi:hypothetical protein